MGREAEPVAQRAGQQLEVDRRRAVEVAEQEDAGLDIVTDGEQSRQHFVHGFLEAVEGIDFEHKVEMGIRANRYKAMVPQVVGPLRLNLVFNAGMAFSQGQGLGPILGVVALVWLASRLAGQAYALSLALLAFLLVVMLLVGGSLTWVYQRTQGKNLAFWV